MSWRRKKQQLKRDIKVYKEIGGNYKISGIFINNEGRYEYYSYHDKAWKKICTKATRRKIEEISDGCSYKKYFPYRYMCY